eukprot:EG_transcript_15097
MGLMAAPGFGLAVLCLLLSACHTNAFRSFRGSWEMPTIGPSKVVFYNNSCVLPRLAVAKAEAPQKFGKMCCNWVVQTLDVVWHGPEPLSHAAIEDHFYENFTSVQQWQVLNGIDAFHEHVALERRAFPEDYRLHVTDCLCQGNDYEGYKAVLNGVVTGTNTGPFYIRPGGSGKGHMVSTKNPVRFYSTSTFFISRVEDRWVYVAEWLQQDTLAKYMQLRVDLNQLPHPEDSGIRLTDCTPKQPGYGWLAPARSGDARPRAPYKPPVEDGDAEGERPGLAGHGARSATVSKPGHAGDSGGE